MNGKSIFGLMVCIMAGLPLQGCCFRANEGATTSLVVGEERITDASEEILSEDGSFGWKWICYILPRSSAFS